MKLVSKIFGALNVAAYIIGYTIIGLLIIATITGNINYVDNGESKVIVKW